MSRLVNLLAFLPLALTSPVPSSPSDAAALPSSPVSSSSAYDWSAGWQTSFPIHTSCNATLRAQLDEALGETVQLAAHARDHILRHGSASELYRRYFGDGPSAVPLGWYDGIAAGDKTGVTFRCDDPDRNCETQDAWAGHWRGENATSETVICPLSFEIRRPLSSACNLGFTVAESPLNTFWATDLMHRALHVPAINGDGAVDHYAEDLAGVLALARDDPSKSGYDSDTLQYFAIDAWAYDMAAPGVGCSGEMPVPEEAAEDDAGDDADATPTETTSAAPSSTSSAPQDCHTHSDGVVHCS